ncbi:unnamed protein product [Sphagnum jensenii]|uniref:Uncharacterized protein n=1 Tax=Sphagnum jensenii TaxID=128206 RepID=A0ABP1A341_9BRYO
MKAYGTTTKMTVAMKEKEEEKKREVEKVRDCRHPSVLFLDFPVEDEETISLLMRKEAHCMTEVENSGIY